MQMVITHYPQQKQKNPSKTIASHYALEQLTSNIITQQKNVP